MIHTEEKISIWESLKSIDHIAIMLCVTGFFLGRVCLFNVFYCIGIAYAGVMFYKKDIQRWSAVLIILGMLSSGHLGFDIARYILILVLMTGIRGGMIASGYDCTLKNQLIITGISQFIIGVLASALEGITLYRILICLLEILATAGIMSVLYIAVRVIYTRKKTALGEYEVASIGFLMACTVCGLIDFYVVVPLFNKIYFKDILIFVIMMGSVYIGKIEGGMIISSIISVTLVIMGYMPASFVTIYIFAALIGGLFSHLERIGIIFATALGLLLGFALFNDKVIDMTIMGAFIAGAVVTLIIPGNYFGLSGWYEKEKLEEKSYQIYDMQEIAVGNLMKFSNALKSLGNQFQKIPVEHYSLELPVMNELIENTGESMCMHCAMREFCWKDYLEDTYKSCYCMLRTLDRQGSIKEGDIPEPFKKACINAESFAYTLGIALDVYKNDCKWHEHFNEARKMMAQQFNGVADSIYTLSKHLEESLVFDNELEELIRNELSASGIHVKEITILKQDNVEKEIHIYCSYRGETDIKERVLGSLEKILEQKLEIKKYQYAEENQYCYFEFTPVKKYKISCSGRWSAKEKVSGDMYSYQELERGRYLMALADGMGSGESAKKESEMTIELVEKFLEAGFSGETAVKIINSALVLKSEVECCTTIDMILIDQYTGVAEFLKAGASASFILRDDEVITVKAGSLPIGILSHVDMVSFKKQLKEGDVVIMVTDGILEEKNQVFDREATFKHFILEADSKSPEYLAEFLMQKTKNLLAGKQNDDMTIVVARVWGEENKK